MSPVFSRLRVRGFDVEPTYHADAILRQDFPEAVTELEEVIGTISIPIIELVRGGGGEAQVTQRLRKLLHEHGWEKRLFHVEKRINDKVTLAQSHEVDHSKNFNKGTLALEIEWNNKDPFFDRDLENFGRLHADGGISLGLIVTRGHTLQDGLEERIRSFGKAHIVTSFADLEGFGIEPTSRQRRAVEQLVQSRTCSFAEAWATCFTRDKFGTATTHWAKLKNRLERGVGSPCPIVGIGIPLSCITE